MRNNRVKRILQSGGTSFGTWLSLGDLFASRMLARLNFDWLTLDLEHGAIDWSQAAMIFAAIADGGGVPLARVPKGNHDYIKRVLDGGAWGIVVPMVDTVEQAKIAIAAAKYPPVGNRSLGGGMHALNFDCSSSEYFKRANDEILVVLQTESPTGVEERRRDLQPAGGRRDFCRPRRPAGADAQSRRHRSHRCRVRSGAGRGGRASVAKTGTPTGMHTMSPRRRWSGPSRGCSSSPSAASCDSWESGPRRFSASSGPTRSRKKSFVTNAINAASCRRESPHDSLSAKRRIGPAAGQSGRGPSDRRRRGRHRHQRQDVGSRRRRPAGDLQLGPLPHGWARIAGRHDALWRRQRHRDGHGPRGDSGRPPHAGSGRGLRHRSVPADEAVSARDRAGRLFRRAEFPDRGADRRHLPPGAGRDRHGLSAWKST